MVPSKSFLQKIMNQILEFFYKQNVRRTKANPNSGKTVLTVKNHTILFPNVFENNAKTNKKKKILNIDRNCLKKHLFKTWMKIKTRLIQMNNIPDIL